MSEADRDDITVSDEQVTVRKTLETEQFETLAVVFDIHSEHTEPTRIQVADTIPDDIPLDDIGFHPNYGAEHWAIEERTVVFEREFSPGEEFTTIYGVRDVDDPDAAFLDEPSIELLDGVDVETGRDPNIDAISDIVSEEHSQIVRDVIAGKTKTMPGVDAEEQPAPDTAEPAEAEAAAETQPAEEPSDVEPEPADEPADVEREEPEPAEEPADEEPEPAEEPPTPDPAAAEAESPDPEAEPEPTQEEPVAAEEPEEPDEPPVDVEAAVHAEFADSDDAPEPQSEADEPEDSEEITVPVTGGVARVLAKELREGTISAEDRRLLREELSTGEGSTEARIRHLQNDVSDLTAYTTALESFLDEEGSAEEIIDDLRSDVTDLRDHVDSELRSYRENLTDELESIQSEMDALRETVSSFDDHLDDTTENVDRLESTVASIRDEVADLQAETDRLDTIDDELESLSGRVGDVRADLDEMSEFRNRLISAVGNPNDPDE